MSRDILIKFVRRKSYRMYTYFQRGIMETEIIDTKDIMDTYCLCEMRIDQDLVKILLMNDHNAIRLKSKDTNGNPTEDFYSIENIILSPISVFDDLNQLYVVVKEIKNIGDRFVDDKYKKFSYRAMQQICFQDKLYKKMRCWDNKIYDYKDEILRKIPEWDEQIKSEFDKKNKQKEEV